MEFYSSPTPMPYQMPYRMPPLPKPRNGIVWYVIILPILGLVLENFATNRYLGILVWGIVVVMRPLSCLLDRARLVKSSFPAPDAASCILPTVYLYSRARLIRGESQLAVICALTLFVGAAGNSFVRGARMTDDDILDAVKASFLTSFDALSDSELDVSLDDAVTDCLTDPEYEIERDGNKRTITLTGKSSENGTVKIEIIVKHDGFTYTDLYFGDVYQDGKLLPEDEVADFLEELFADSMNDDETDSSETE